MPRKLKTYETSIGFYDLAVAAPSMKAALEAWGAESNLFHQGVARETNDPDVIAATIAHPGIVLKRPVGSSGKFGEQSPLPRLTRGEVKGTPGKAASRAVKRGAPKIDDATKRKAALQFEKEEKRREIERRREEAAAAKKRERRDKAAAKAHAVFEAAKLAHDERVAGFEEERAAIEKRAEAEGERWKLQRQKLDSALRRFKQSGPAQGFSDR